MDFVWIEAETFTMGTSESGLRRSAAGRDRGDPDSKGDYLGARLPRTG
jgi:hypothetical protein